MKKLCAAMAALCIPAAASAMPAPMQAFWQALQERLILAGFSRHIGRSFVPHLTVVVDIDPGEGRRRRGDVHDRMESEAEGFHAAVRGHFLALAESAPDRYLVVDGSASPDEIARLVWERVTEDGLA